MYYLILECENARLNERVFFKLDVFHLFDAINNFVFSLNRVALGFGP